jgi:hypothetical protein
MPLRPWCQACREFITPAQNQPTACQKRQKKPQTKEKDKNAEETANKEDKMVQKEQQSGDGNESGV